MLIAIVVYQQIENYLFSPRITARTMELHPARGVRRRPRRCRRARRRRCRPRAAGGGDGAGADLATGATATRSSRNDLVEVRHPPGVEAVGEDPPGPEVTARLRAGRRGVAQRHRREHPPRRRRRPRPPTARWRGRPATPTSRSSPARRSSRCRPRRWSAPGWRSTTGCWPSCAPATTAAPSTSPRCARSSPAPASTRRDLDNTPALPLEADAMRAVRAGRRRRRLRSPRTAAASMRGCWRRRCVNGWPTDGYRDPDHPVQRLILDDLRGPRRRGDARSASTAAVRRRRSCRSPGWPGRCAGWPSSGHQVHRAMTGHPEMVGGPRRDVTRLMRLVPGLMAKDGAEGVQVAALPDGRAVAVKIADGGGRARTPVTVAALQAARRRHRRRRDRRAGARSRRAGRRASRSLVGAP